MGKLKKLFGGINLTWKKVIIFAILAGVYTASMAIIPQLEYTSFHTIVATLEVWILFGLFIIMNSKLNPYVYSTNILSKVDDVEITSDYKVSLANDKYGEVYIEYLESIDTYIVHANFKKQGDTKLIVETPEGAVKEYNLHIEMDTFKFLDK